MHLLCEGFWVIFSSNPPSIKTGFSLFLGSGCMLTLVLVALISRLSVHSYGPRSIAWQSGGNYGQRSQLLTYAGVPAVALPRSEGSRHSDSCFGQDSDVHERFIIRCKGLHGRSTRQHPKLLLNYFLLPEKCMSGNNLVDKHGQTYVCQARFWMKCPVFLGLFLSQA